MMMVSQFFMPAFANNVVKPEVVKLWTYYNFPPFLQSNFEQGLVVDLASMLTEHSEGRFHFVVEFLPRKRIDMLLDSEQLGAVALVNPHWFSANLLASIPLLNGHDIVISPAARHIENVDRKNIINKQFIGVIGHHYPVIIDESGVSIVYRQNVSSIKSLFKLIAKQRGDFAIVPGLVAAYHQARDEYSDQLSFSPQTQQAYTRHIVMANQQVALKHYIDSVLLSKSGQKQWLEMIKSYHLEMLTIAP